MRIYFMGIRDFKIYPNLTIGDLVGRIRLLRLSNRPYDNFTHVQLSLS